LSIAALIGCYVFVGTGTTGGTAPGGASAPTGCTINGTTADVSAWAFEVNTEDEVDVQDSTTFGSGGYKMFVQGLKSATVEVGFFQDYAGSSINVYLGHNGTIGKPGDATLGQFFIEVRASSAARSATNPGFIAKVVHQGCKAYQAKVGDIPLIGVKLQPTGGYAELIA
jgi:hypothetical protein